jgi:hypothetical protein
MKSQPFATKWRVVFPLFASCGIFALPAHAATCSGSMPTGPTAYVATSPNLVTVLDASTSTPTVACTIAVGSTLTSNPKNLALSPDGTQLFVENDGEASVSAVDLSTGGVTNISLTTSGVTAPMTADLAVSPDGKFVYVVSLPNPIPANTQATLNIITLPLLSVSGAISVVAPLPAPPTPVTGPGLGIAITPDATTAYIATEGLTYVVTAGASPTISPTVTVSGGTAAVAPNGTFVYVVDVASDANTISKITTATNAASSFNPSPTCSLANTIAITPDSSSAYYTCPGSDFLQAINTSTNAVATIDLATNGLGVGPQGVAITSDGASAYVANGDGSISVVPVSGSPITNTTVAGTALAGIGFRPVQVTKPSPATASVPTAGTQQFTSAISYAFSAGVTSLRWAVNGIPGGNNTIGSISASGLYTAPSTIPSPAQVTISVTSTESLPYYGAHPFTATVTITPSKLAFTVEPVNGVAGSPLATVTVAIEDASGNVVTSGAGSNASIIITSAATPATPAVAPVTETATASGGVATFSTLILTQANIPPAPGSTTVTPYSYTLTAASTTPGLTSALSNPFTISSAAAAKLVFTTGPAPTGSVAGSPLNPAPGVVVAVEDAFNNVVTTGTGSTALITMTPASTPSGITAFLGSSTNQVFAVGGVATFSNLILTQANIPPQSGSMVVTTYSYTMTPSTTPPLDTSPSNPFVISPAPIAKLAFTTPPVNGTAGNALSAIIVAAEDANGNVVTTGPGSTVSITMNPASTPPGITTFAAGSTNPVSAVGGIASFSNLILTQVGTTPLAATKYNYTLTAAGTIPPLMSPPSNPFMIAPGPPTQLVFNTQPVSGVTAGSALAPVVVYVEDAFSNVVTGGAGSNPLITMTPASTPPGIATFSAGSANPVSALGGVATFNNLILTQANIPPPSGSTTVTPYSYTMTASSTALALVSPPSNPFAISAAAATKLVFATQPANGTAALAIGAVNLAVEDAFSNVVTGGPGSNASIALTSTATNTAVCFTGGGGGGGGGSPVIAGAVGGVATFSGLTFTLAGSYTLTAQTALPPSLPVSVTSSSFAIAAGPPTQLVFKTEPVNGTAGIALAPVVVCVDDANNNVVTDPTVPASKASIMISSASAPFGAAGVSGATAVNAMAGVATFSGLILTQVGVPPFAATKYGYTLTATSGALTAASSTPTIMIVAGPATTLVFAGSPAGSNAGLAVQNVSVFVEDANGNIVTDPAVAASTASIAISSGSTPSGAASVGGTPTVAASGGVATFNNLILTQVGTTPLATTVYNYTLTAKVSAPGALTGLTTATSGSFTIAPGTAAQLAFAQPLASGVTLAGSPLANVAVYVEDAFSNVVTSGAGSNASIMVTPASAPSGITTFAGGSTNPVPAVGGVATFSNLILTKANMPPPSGSTTVTPYNYTLAAASAAPALTTSAPSNSFTILPAAGTRLIFTTQPANGTAGVALGTVNVAVEDTFGNVATSGPGSNAAVSITSTAAPATPIAVPVDGTTTVSAAGGIATFSSLILKQVGTTPLATTPYNYTLTAASGGLTSTSSTPAITIVPGAPAQLAFNKQPESGTPAGSPLTPVMVYVEDATGLNVVTTGVGSNASITLTPASTPSGITTFAPGSTNPVTAAGGVATFNNLILTQVGTTPLATTKYNYTLTASSGGMTSANTSPTTTIVPGAATQLAFSAQPVSGTAAGTALASVVVYVEDATGLNVVTSGPGSNALITMAPASTPSGITTFSGGATSVSAVGGVATFSSLILTHANIPPPSGSATVTPYSYSMAAASTTPALTTPPSSPFSIMPAAANKLVFTTQPVNGAAGSALAPVFVSVEDQFGNVATSDSSTVRMAIGAVAQSGEGGFTGDSTTGVAAVGGVAAFANLKSTRSATLTLSGSDGTLTGATSTSFVVVGNPAGVTPAGSPGSSQANPLNITLTQNTVSADVDLLGPAPSDGVTFTVACAQPTPLNSSTPFAGVACAPSQSAPITTMGSATGNTQIPITINVVRTSSSAPVRPGSPSTFGTTEVTRRGLFVLAIAIALFVFGGFRLTRMPGPKTLYGFAFVLLLCLSLAWMSACTQFSTTNFPAPPVSNAQSGPGSAVVTITPSGPGPGGDNFQTKTITIYFNVLNTQ